MRSAGVLTQAPAARIFAWTGAAVLPRTLLDLENLKFAQGGHLKSNRTTTVPEGAWRTQKKGYEEVHVPAAKVPPPSPDEPVVYIKDLPDWARAAFAKTEKLNRVQSVLYKTGTIAAMQRRRCATRVRRRG